MYKQEEIKPYHEGEKASQVEALFDNIAPSYDKLNHRVVEHRPWLAPQGHPPAGAV